MDALIITCGTGGGHNVCAAAIEEEMKKRGHNAVVLNPYELVSHKLASDIGGAYISLVRMVPILFGVIYAAGQIYEKLPIHSPVYTAHRRLIRVMGQYMDGHHFDAVFATNILPGMILAGMKEDGIALPPRYYVATDYTCIPFTRETDSDYYLIPSPLLADKFLKHGIKEEQIKPFGIPVRSQFREPTDRDTALEKLGLSPDRRYYMLMGGSIGAGRLKKSVRQIIGYMKNHTEMTLIVICGSNKSLHKWLKRRWGNDEHIILLTETDYVAEYMVISDVVISKPGGLSSTEAAVIGAPLIHIAPIPGCETYNRQFFAKTGMSLAVRYRRQLTDALDCMRQDSAREMMRNAQREGINPYAARDICDFAESIAESHI